MQADPVRLCWRRLPDVTSGLTFGLSDGLAGAHGPHAGICSESASAEMRASDLQASMRVVRLTLRRAGEEDRMLLVVLLEAHALGCFEDHDGYDFEPYDEFLWSGEMLEWWRHWTGDPASAPRPSGHSARTVPGAWLPFGYATRARR
jgi:hypothetical protein